MNYQDIILSLQNGNVMTSMVDGIYGRSYLIENNEVNIEDVNKAFAVIGIENIKQDRMGGPEKTVLFSMYKEEFYDQE